MPQLRGRLITTVGSPAAGKTFLADKLAAYFNAEIIYERPPEGLPAEIKQNFDTESHLFETILWFRNRQIQNHLHAKALLMTGKNVVTDVPLYHNQLFVGAYIRDRFLQSILYTMGELDRSLNGYPDCTVYISTTPELVQEYLAKRIGSREWENDRWREIMTTMPTFVEAYMKSIESEIPGLIEVKRADYDFALDADFQRLVEGIQSIFTSQQKGGN